MLAGFDKQLLAISVLPLMREWDLPRAASPRSLRARASSAKRAIAVSTTMRDDSSSDSRMPMNVPRTPTVTPLPARSPSMAVLKRPTTVPRRPAGARICTSVCAIDVNVMLNTPASTSSATAT